MSSGHICHYRHGVLLPPSVIKNRGFNIYFFFQIAPGEDELSRTADMHCWMEQTLFIISCLSKSIKLFLCVGEGRIAIRMSVMNRWILHIHTHTHTHTHTYIYIYIYVCVCVGVCRCGYVCAHQYILLVWVCYRTMLLSD